MVAEFHFNEDGYFVPVDFVPKSKRQPIRVSPPSPARASPTIAVVPDPPITAAADQFLRIPPALFDEIMPTLTPPEFMVFSYIVRRTLGWGKREDAISLRQFCSGITRKDGSARDRGTGLSRRCVIQAIQALEEKRRIVVTRRTTDGGDSDISLYRPVL